MQFVFISHFLFAQMFPERNILLFSHIAFSLCPNSFHQILWLSIYINRILKPLYEYINYYNVPSKISNAREATNFANAYILFYCIQCFHNQIWIIFWIKPIDWQTIENMKENLLKKWMTIIILYLIKVIINFSTMKLNHAL